MKSAALMDLYTDFLTSSPNVASALLLSEVLEHTHSHDSITRMLAQKELSQKEYWSSIKTVVREVESLEEGVISVDDVITHKPHSAENELISWYYDHTSGQSAKGINIITFTYVNPSIEPKVKLPLAFELVRKDKEVVKTVKKKGKFIEKKTRQSSISKNELVRKRLHTLTYHNQVAYKYIAFDTWYAATDTLKYIVQKLKKHFVAAIKSNRLVRLSSQETGKKKPWMQVSEADFEPNRVYQVYLKGVPFPLHLVKRVYYNLDGTVGVQYLVTSDTDLRASKIDHIYQHRWSSEDIHRSLKQNVALEKMPAKKESSQANHLFASMLAQVKLECMKIATKLNHYALKRMILIKALQKTWGEVKELKQRVSEKSISFPNLSTA